MASTSNESIRVEHLVERFGSITAVDDLSFTVAPGGLFGFLWLNGALHLVLVGDIGRVGP